MIEVPFDRRRPLRRIRDHGGVMLTHNADWDRPRYVLINGGGQVEYLTVKSAIANGWLIPQRDGLFAETSQTYQVAPGLDIERKPKPPKKPRKRKDEPEAVAA